MTQTHQNSTPGLEAFGAWQVQSTRWADNDMFGHLNNAVYYELFDASINTWAISSGGFDPMRSLDLPLVAESSCRYLREVAFPDRLAVGLGVDRLGTSSIVYRLGLFRADETGAPTGGLAAMGRWVHVFTSRKTRRPSQVPQSIRDLVAQLPTGAQPAGS